MTESKEKLSEDVAEKIQPEDLIAQMRKELAAARSLLEGPRMGLENWFIAKIKRFIEEAEEKLAKSQEPIVIKQIDEAYQELIEQHPKLKKEIGIVQNASALPPKEFELKDLKSSAQKQVGEKKSVFPEMARKLLVLPDEFRTMPEKFRLYVEWLLDAEKNFSNQAIPFRSLPEEKQQEISSVSKIITGIVGEMKKGTVPDNIMVLNMASAINTWIRLLGEIGVSDPQLSKGAFGAWMNSRRMGQGGGAGYQLA